jgi:dipeptidase E
MNRSRSASRIIVAIGGGELRDRETLPIDTEIVRLTRGAHPHALFIPTASDDADGYCETFAAVYGGDLECRTRVLRLHERYESHEECARLIEWADLVYVGGGNTLRMMRRWRRLGVDALLRRAWERGTVMSGLSAGAICWFRYGTSDSRRFYDPNDDTLIRVRGLGWIDAVASPHHTREPNRNSALASIVARTPGVGLAFDDCAALVIEDDRYRIMRSAAEAGVRKVYRHRGRIVEEALRDGAIADLLAPA